MAYTRQKNHSLLYMYNYIHFGVFLSCGDYFTWFGPALNFPSVYAICHIFQKDKI